MGRVKYSEKEDGFNVRMGMGVGMGMGDSMDGLSSGHSLMDGVDREDVLGEMAVWDSKMAAQGRSNRGMSEVVTTSKMSMKAESMMSSPKRRTVKRSSFDGTQTKSAMKG